MQRTGGMGANSRAVVNTNFLLNTVHGIGSHNRREEVEDCWRQRRLDQDDRKHGKEDKEGTQGTHLPIATGKRRREVSYQKAPLEEAAASVDDTRAFWAEQKQRAMAGIGAATAMEGAVSTTMQTGTNVERSPKKKSMGELEGCNSNSGSRNNSWDTLLGAERKKRTKTDQKKDKKDKKDKKSKDSKKEKRKREGRGDARDADNNTVEESQRKQTSELESGVVGSSRKKRKKSNKKSTSTRKGHKKYAKRRTEN